jgi:hypothetical protein
MSTPFYDLASLVVLPSGYKSQKIYAQKPLTTDGQLTFTRASNATRVASNGLIERVRTNLLLQSEGFSTASWTKDSGASVTANTTTAPDGTTTADTLTISDSQYMYQSVTLVAGNPYTISVYVKVSSGTNQFKFNTFGSSNNFTSSAYTATTTWQRFSYTFTAVGSGSTAIYPILVDGLAGGSFFIWGAQIEAGDIATDYIATTSAAVSVGPVSGVPRLDYLGSTCPKLLLEPQRTNLVLFSEQFDNAYWTKTRATISANNATSPDGYTNADKLVENAISGTHFVDRTITGLTASAVHSFSIFAKKAEREFVNLQCVTTENSVFVNLNNGTISIAGGYTSSTVKVESYSNSWYRITVNDTPPSTSLRYIIVTATDSTTSSYAGNGTSGILIYGAQLEAGAYATSYINTLSTSVTRVAESASKTGIASLIGQTEGTVFVEVDIRNTVNVSRVPITISSPNASTSTSSAYLFINGSGNLVFEFITAGLPQCVISAGPVQLGVQKLAIAYKNNDFVFYRNGALIGSDGTGTVVSGFDRLFVGNFSNSTLQLNDRISQALLFKTRLTNAQLAELTTL